MREALFWREDGAGRLRVMVRATPKSSRDGIDGPGQDAAGQGYLKVRVRAVPEKGKANVAVAQVLAAALGVSRGEVAVLTGDTARVKALGVPDTPQVRARLLEWAGGEASDDGEDH